MVQNIVLTKTETKDLITLFEFQLDKKACYLAAFTPEDPADKTAYLEKFTRLIADPSINMRTIKLGNQIVGSMAKFMIDQTAEITYWIDRKYWGQGIASTALKNFLKTERVRPIHGRVAFDNYSSQQVLKKCGFVQIGKDKGFANARQTEIEEYIYRLL